MHTSAPRNTVTFPKAIAQSPAARCAEEVMKAVVYDKYGPLDILNVRDIEKPVVNDDEVFVRVHAAGLNIDDCFSVRGRPFAMRMATGLLNPKRHVPGFDLAGQVESVGKNVRQFRPGDEVFGVCNNSACAEYACAKEDKLALKPANLTFEEAAAVPISAFAVARYQM